MTPRPYFSPRRSAIQEATRLRILEATVALHAEKGSLSTTYADIAARADVAIPTVYKHFPDMGVLLRGCTGLAAASAPVLGPEIFEGLKSIPDRIGALVDAVFKLHAYFAPWKRWGETEHFPELKEIAEWERKQLRALIRLCLAPGGPPPPSLVGLAEVLLSFPAWSSLRRDPKIPPGKAVREALTLFCQPHRKEIP